MEALKTAAGLPEEWVIIALGELFCIVGFAFRGRPWASLARTADHLRGGQPDGPEVGGDPTP
eukprot:852979-Pyramimonas_sp.AAC.1